LNPREPTAATRIQTARLPQDGLVRPWWGGGNLEIGRAGNIFHRPEVRGDSSRGWPDKPYHSFERENTWHETNDFSCGTKENSGGSESALGKSQSWQKVV